ncbi:sigma-54-dependent Fis family transcriptional regulator, partial [Candidatus Peregrinibacteria bacterium]|nr:sigma-54-dependent Fis family transcriptional regulator [Candidatus Peregrinibacteria bacterium]
MPAKILVVDDERLIRWSLSERLKKEGYQIVEAENGAMATEKFGSEMPDIVLLDLKLPDADGLTLLKEFKSQSSSTPVLIITAFSAVDSAIEAMKLGAYDYIAKPFNMDEMVLILQRTLETTALRREVSAIVSEQRQRYGLQNIIGKSKKILDILSLVRKVAKSEATTILLRGESGTG